MHDLLVLTLGLLRYIGNMGKDKAYITLLFPQQGSYYDSVKRFSGDGQRRAGKWEQRREDPRLTLGLPCWRCWGGWPLDWAGPLLRPQSVHASGDPYNGANKAA